VTEYALKYVDVQRFQNYVEATPCSRRHCSTVQLVKDKDICSIQRWLSCPGHCSCGQRCVGRRVNSDNAIICLCDISPEYRLTRRASVITTARRPDRCVQLYQMSLIQWRWCSNLCMQPSSLRALWWRIARITCLLLRHQRAGQWSLLQTFICRLSVIVIVSVVTFTVSNHFCLWFYVCPYWF